jgi:hypothetical protein
MGQSAILNPGVPLAASKNNEYEGTSHDVVDNKGQIFISHDMYDNKAS